LNATRGEAVLQLAQVASGVEPAKQGYFPKYLVINHRKLIPALPPSPQVDYFWFWCEAFYPLA
jgi:hypothetical protein